MGQVHVHRFTGRGWVVVQLLISSFYISSLFPSTFILVATIEVSIRNTSLEHVTLPQARQKTNYT